MNQLKSSFIHEEKNKNSALTGKYIPKFASYNYSAVII